MPSCLKYFHIHRKIILNNGFHLPSTFNLYCYKSKFCHLKQIDFTRKFSTYICRENFLPFEEMIEGRRLQARKSIVVEIGRDDSILSLESLCCKAGEIKSISEFRKPERMVLIEFEKENSVEVILEMAQTSSNGNYRMLQSPFLKLNNGLNLEESNSVNCDKKSTNLDISVLKLPENSKLLDKMKSDCSNISEQIQYCYDFQKMKDLSWRLRFLTCRKIEWALPKSLSHSRVIPFGSSVNTFGHNYCDLDMIIDVSSLFYPKDTNFPLKFQEISNKKQDKILEIIANLLLYYMPGFEEMVKIPHATVPIIKCKDVFTRLDCDICVYNMSAYFMSEILYLYGCSDPRVRPLVFCIRLWAKQKRLTRKDQPWLWFSNFTMTTMVLYFLMNTRAGPVIPPLSAMEKFSNNSFTYDGIPCSYTRDVKNIPLSTNNQTLEELLFDFFNFYASFNYKNGISIISGKSFPKLMNTALYIENPLELNRNISKAVRYEHIEAFKEECIKAISVLSEKNEKNSSTNSWGVPSLLEKQNRSSLKRITVPFNLKNVFEATSNKDQRDTKEMSLSSSENAVFKKETLANSRGEPFTNKKTNHKKGSKLRKRPSYHF